MNRISLYKQYKDRQFGFNTALLDVFAYLLVLGAGWKLGHPIGGVVAVVVFIGIDLVVANIVGKSLEG